MAASAFTAGPSLAGMVATILLKVAFGFPSENMTPTTASPPESARCTKCASIGKLLPPIRCSLGR